MTELKTLRTRNWNLTINEGSTSFDLIQKILDSVPTINEYYYILHDKDNLEQPHYHLVIRFRNARSFEGVRNMFPGAHCEVCKSFCMSCRYLIHQLDPDKYPYPRTAVIAKNQDKFDYYLLNEDYVVLDTQSITDYVLEHKVNNLFDALKYFGIYQTNMYRVLIMELIKERG